MSKKIKITCEAATIIPIGELVPFQGDLKRLSKEKAAKLQNSLVEEGFSFPVFAWKHKGVNYILDAHQRIKILKLMMDDGWSIDGKGLPVAWIYARNEKHAKKKILMAASVFGETTDSSLHDYLEAAQIEIEDVMDQIDIPYVDIDLENNRENFDDLDKENEDLAGKEEGDIKITVPKEHRAEVMEWLANGEILNPVGMGRGVLKRCELL